MKASWPSRRGSALIVALWTILLLSLLVGTLAFNMHVEAAITSAWRRRVHAEWNARSGVAYAQWLLSRFRTLGEGPLPENMDEAVGAHLRQLRRFLAVRLIEHDLGEGVVFDLTIEPENARRNIHALDTADWYEVLYRAGVPEEHWDKLIACFLDWTDPDEAHRLLGAEKDDPFYEERGYEPANAPLQTIAELVLVKGFSHELVFGGPSPWVEGETLTGIANWLTVRGDGRINPAAADRGTLLTIPGLTDADVDAILEAAKGPDGELGTEDDGFADAVEFAAATGIADPNVWQRLSFDEQRYFRVASVGRSGQSRYAIHAVIRVEANTAVIVEWAEGQP